MYPHAPHGLVLEPVLDNRGGVAILSGFEDSALGTLFPEIVNLYVHVADADALSLLSFSMSHEKEREKEMERRVLGSVV